MTTNATSAFAPSSPSMHRRSAVRLLAASVGMTLSACALPVSTGVPPTATPPATLGATAGVGGQQTGSGAATADILPAYIQQTGGPRPDYPSTGPLYEDGFESYPRNPSATWKNGPPGLGSTVQTLNVAAIPIPPTPLDQNPAWQEVNRRLNATVNFTAYGSADYIAKIATIMAGNDLPDIVYLYSFVGIPGVAQLVEKTASDLTPYLAGDAIRDYPNLAAIPTYSWKNSGSIQNGRLYGVPLHRYAPGPVMYRNTEIYDREIGPNYVPKSADDFKRVLQQLNRPADGRYALGTYQGAVYFLPAYAAMFGAPNNWTLDSTGNLVKDIETSQFKGAVGFVRDLVALGLFHPDSQSFTDTNAARAAYLGSKWVVYTDLFGIAWQDIWVRGAQVTPRVSTVPLPPFAAEEDGKATHFLSAGFAGPNMIKKASESRIKEILRIMDWLAAPFGSAEDLLLTVGVPEVDYTLDQAGTVIPTSRSGPDANAVNWKYLAQHNQVAYAAGAVGFAKAATDFEKLAIPAGVSDPTLGYASATFAAKGLALSHTLNDALTDIIAGRRPLADYDQIVKDWQAGGGDQIRKEYQHLLSA